MPGFSALNDDPLHHQKKRSKFAITVYNLLSSTMDVFVQRKTAILNDLGSDQPDLSPKGRPDDEVLELLELLNTHANYVSTSSCSGRAVVYLDADKNGQGDEARGRWLMNRHSPFQKETGLAMKEWYGTLFGDMKVGENWDSKIRPSRLVNLKFEPLVLLS
jgi:tRNA wybutosine-synthesizing protein 3